MLCEADVTLGYGCDGLVYSNVRLYSAVLLNPEHACRLLSPTAIKSLQRLRNPKDRVLYFEQE